MITLTIKCSRCSKDFSQDVTNQTLNNDLIRKFGFVYAHNGKTNVVICSDCEKKFKDLQARLETVAQTQLRGFFGEKEKENGYKGGTKIG